LGRRVRKGLDRHRVGDIERQRVRSGPTSNGGLHRVDAPPTDNHGISSIVQPPRQRRCRRR
jgi:hypothetical protein